MGLLIAVFLQCGRREPLSTSPLPRGFRVPFGEAKTAGRGDESVIVSSTCQWLPGACYARRRQVAVLREHNLRQNDPTHHPVLHPAFEHAGGGDRGGGL